MKSKYKPYSSYRDSGVEWLGDVPDGWDIKPFWTLYNRQKRTGYAKEILLSVYRDYGVIQKSSRDDNNNKASEDLSGYQLVNKSDLAMNKMKAWQGSLGVSKFRGIVSPAYFVFESLHHQYNKYLHHLMRSPRYIAGYLSMSKGIRVNQWDLDPQYHSRMPVLLPSIEEQQTIANYLDIATAKIDTLIEKQTKLIELLKEKRQAVISTAVTRGLDSTVAMKDSGVEWLGEIPEDWEALQLKRISSIKGGYAYSTSDFKEEGVQIIKIGNVYQSKFHTDRQPTFVSQEVARRTREFLIIEGDLIISLTGTLGKRDYGYAVTVDQKGEYLLNQRVAKMLPNNKLVTTEYLSYTMKSEQYLTQIYALPSGTKQANLSNDNVLSAVCALPSLQEQEEIVEHIDDRTSKLDNLMTKATKAIDLLKEKRTALISAVVTGKVDVRTYIKETVDEL